MIKEKFNFDCWPVQIMQEMIDILEKFDIAYARQVLIESLSIQDNPPPINHFLDITHWPQDIRGEASWMLGVYNPSYLHGVIFDKLKARMVAEAYTNPGMVKIYETYKV